MLFKLDHEFISGQRFGKGSESLGLKVVFDEFDMVGVGSLQGNDLLVGQKLTVLGGVRIRHLVENLVEFLDVFGLVLKEKSHFLSALVG